MTYSKDKSAYIAPPSPDGLLAANEYIDAAHLGDDFAKKKVAEILHSELSKIAKLFSKKWANSGFAYATDEDSSLGVVDETVMNIIRNFDRTEAPTAELFRNYCANAIRRNLYALLRRERKRMDDFYTSSIESHHVNEGDVIADPNSGKPRIDPEVFAEALGLFQAILTPRESQVLTAVIDNPRMEYREIGTLLGCSADAVKMSMFRAKNKIENHPHTAQIIKDIFEEIEPPRSGVVQRF